MTTPLPFQSIDDFTLRRIIQDTPYSLSVESYQNALQRKVFLKLLKPQIKDHRVWYTRFQREAQICAKLKNPHIVDVFTMGEKESFTYMAMEFVEGFSLKDLLDREKALSPAISFEITRQVLLALQFAHQHGIIHRDIKPGNILIDIYGDVRLTDFGLAYLGEENSLTQQGAILGTPAYMSPEQITGETLTQASDFFSLGVTLFEMLTGNKAFAGDNYSACMQKILNHNPPSPSTFNQIISSDQENIVLKLIHKNPAQRPANAHDILDQFKTINIGENILSSNVKNNIALLIKTYHSSHPEIEKSSMNSKTTGPEGNQNSEKSIFRKWFSPAIGIVAAIFLLIFILYLPPEEKTPHAVTPPFPEEIDTLSNTSSESDSKSDMDFSENKKLPNPEQPFSQDSSLKLENNIKKQADLSFKIADEENKNKSGENLVRFADWHLNIHPWAKITLDGNMVDSMVITKKITLSPGKHQLILSHPEFAPKIFNLEAVPGEVKKIDYSFLQEAGYLSVEVRPWADIYIDGKHIDSTPLDRLILLSQGEHMLELRNPYYDTFRKILNIAAGDTLHLRQRLNKAN